MKGTYDKKKVPREALAYLLDSTGAPVCVLIPFSSWAAYFGAIFLQQDCVKKLAGGSPDEDIYDGNSILCLSACGSFNSISFVWDGFQSLEA